MTDFALVSADLSALAQALPFADPTGPYAEGTAPQVFFACATPRTRDPRVVHADWWASRRTERRELASEFAIAVAPFATGALAALIGADTFLWVVMGLLSGGVLSIGSIIVHGTPRWRRRGLTVTTLTRSDSIACASRARKACLALWEEIGLEHGTVRAGVLDEALDAYRDLLGVLAAREDRLARFTADVRDLLALAPTGPVPPGAVEMSARDLTAMTGALMDADEIADGIARVTCELTAHREALAARDRVAARLTGSRSHPDLALPSQTAAALRDRADALALARAELT